MHFWRSLIKQSTRAAIIILPIKLSVDSGVWSTNAEKGASLYSRLKSDVIPGTIVYFEEMPSFSDAKLLLVNKWNGFVNCTFASANRAATMFERKE
uniref:MICOS complex subunit MIC13 n=1 Tax=Meloidogyne incognita TaxID=6306 RepID=A0A914LEF8_MELIC